MIAPMIKPVNKVIQIPLKSAVKFDAWINRLELFSIRITEPASQIIAAINLIVLAEAVNISLADFLTLKQLRGETISCNRVC